MKLTTAIAALAPTACHALVGNSWTFENSPDGGLKDITFPMQLTNAPHETQFYFAQQFNFGGTGAMGYTGLQPNPDVDAEKTDLRGVFSSFTAGTTTTDPNCHEGADGGPGVSCGAFMNGNYSNKMIMVVENVSGTTWKGTAVDTVTGGRKHIGSWTLPAGTTGLLSSQMGFVEDYRGRNGGDCSTMQKTEVTFFNPTTTTPGAGAGALQKPYEYGDCEGKAGVVVTQIEGETGYKVAVGFK